ncbi:translocation/assembly module TamB domain-containing protein [bacterium]|nr:translocation/assembly module TamB domain-containing protein [candidate division CSSED10-310 bacterium]
MNPENLETRTGSLLRFFIKGILYGTISIILALILFISLFHIPAVQDTVTGILLNQISGYIHRDVKAERIRISVLGSIEIHHASIANDPGFADEDMIAVDRIYCRFNPIEFLNQKVHIESLTLVKPVFRLAYSEDKNSNIHMLQKRNGKSPKQNREDDSRIRRIFDLIRADRIDLTEGIFELDYRPRKLTVKAPLINFHAETSVDQNEIHITAETVHSQTTLNDRFETYCGVFLEADLWGDGIHGSSVTIATDSGATWITGKLDLRKFTDPQLDFSGVVRTNLMEVSRALSLPRELTGETTIKVEGSGPARDLDIQAYLVSEDPRFDRIHASQLYAEALYRDRKFLFPHLAGQLYGGDVSGSGEITFKSNSKDLQFNLSVDQFDFAAACRDQNLPLAIPGEGQVSVTIRNPGFKTENLKISGHISGNEHPISVLLNPLSIYADFGYDTGEFTIHRATVNNETIRADMISGLFVPEQMNAEIRTNIQDINSLLTRIESYFITPVTIPDIHGTTAGIIHIGGSPQSYDVGFRLTGMGMRIDEVPIDRVRLEGSVDPGRMEIRNLAIDGDTADMNGQLVFSRDVPGGQWSVYECSLDINSLMLAPASDIVGLVVEPDGMVSGTLIFNRNPAICEPSQLKLQRLKLNGIELGSGSIQLLWSPEGIQEVWLETRPGVGSLVATGNFRYSRQPEWEVQVTNFNFERLNGVQPIPLYGFGSLDIRQVNPDGESHILLSADIPNTFIRDIPAGSVRAEAVVRLSGVPGIDWEAVISAYGAVISGQTILADNYPTVLRADLMDMPLQPLIAASPVFDWRDKLSGHVTGSINAFFDIKDLNTLDTRGSIQSLHINAADHPFQLDKPTGFRIDGETLTIAPSVLKNKDITMTVQGVLVFSGDMDLKIMGNWNLNTLSDLTDFMQRPSGNLEVDLQIEGPISDPDFFGKVLVQELFFKNPTFNMLFEDFHGEVSFDQKLAKIKYMEGLAGGAYLSVSGDIGVQNYLPALLDLSIVSEKIAFQYPPGFKSTGNVNFLLSGNLSSPLLDGRIDLLRTLYNKRFDYKTMIVSESRKILLVKEREIQPDIADAAGFNPRLRIRVIAPENVSIDNNFAKIEMKLDLEIIGNLTSPGVLGEIQALDGSIEYQGREFTLDRFTLDFADPDRVDPVIDLSAFSEIEGYLVTIEITGSLLTDPKIYLHSSPPLNELDLVSLIGLGKTSEQLTQGSGDYLAGGVAYVTGSLQDVLEKRFKYWMGFDEFSIDPVLSTTDDSPSARITVKKYFGPNLSVTYSRSAGSTEDLLMMEYRVSDNIYLVGRKNEDGSGSGDIRLRWEFR